VAVVNGGPRSAFLIGTAGPSVIVPGRLAAMLEARCDLSGLRTRIRGLDPEASAVLESLHVAALMWRTSSTGSSVAPAAEVAASSTWLSTTQAAAVAGVTPRAVRLAAEEGRLEAVQVGKAWRVSREDLAHWQAARQAARRAA
jgi:excisionase family DNA binding protein